MAIPLRAALVSARGYDTESFSRWGNQTETPIDIVPIEARLTPETAVTVRGYPLVCPFVHDDLSGDVVRALADGGTRMIALRCAGYNALDLDAARACGLVVTRVPAYSPASVAEHTVGLMLSLNRHLHRAFNRVREGNFELAGLLGFEMRGRTVGIIGTGRVGIAVARILAGFGMTLLGYDVYENPDAKALGLTYVPLEELLERSDIITLHCPLTPDTHHLMNAKNLSRCKPGVMVVNTGRGQLVDAAALVESLKSGQVGALGMDVYEQEESLFFRDRSNEVLQDDVFSRLLTFPNVMVTGHQAFFTRESLDEIARITLDSMHRFINAQPIPEDRRVV